MLFASKRLTNYSQKGMGLGIVQSTSQTTFDIASFRTPIIFPCSQDMRLPPHILLPANESVFSTDEFVRQQTLVIKKASHIGFGPRPGRSSALGTEQESVEKVILAKVHPTRRAGRIGAKRRGSWPRRVSDYFGKSGLAQPKKNKSGNFFWENTVVGERLDEKVARQNHQKSLK